MYHYKVRFHQVPINKVDPADEQEAKGLSTRRQKKHFQAGVVKVNAEKYLAKMNMKNYCNSYHFEMNK